MRRCWLGICFCSLIWVCCGKDDESDVKLDPNYWLLRQDLPNPHQVNALTIAPQWGSSGWMADIPKFDYGYGPSLTTKGVIHQQVDPGWLAPYRLQSTRVRLHLDPTERILTGWAEVILSIEQELSQVNLSLSASRVEEVISSGPEVIYQYQDDVLTIMALSPLPSGTSWTLQVSWRDENVEREIDYFPEGYNSKLLIALLSEESTYFTFGYFFWPKPEGIGKMEDMGFEVTYPSQMTLLLPGVLQGSVDNQNDTKTDTVLIPHPVVAHLSLALGNYEVERGECGQTSIEVYALPGRSGQHYPIHPSVYVPVLEDICQSFASWMGNSVFPVIRMVGVDERFLNGYAAPGLFLVPNYTLDDDGTGSFPQRDFYIAHEMSHQWVGNELFMKDFQDAWLIEGLADYLAMMYLESKWGQHEALFAWLSNTDILRRFLEEEYNDRPLVPLDPEDLKPQVTYIKGSWVFRMLERVIGREDLLEILRGLKREHSLAEISTLDFVAATERSAEQTMDWFFGQWLYGTGLISWESKVEKIAAGLRLTVTQHTGYQTNPELYYHMPVDLLIRMGPQSDDSSAGWVSEVGWIEGRVSQMTFAIP